jgi:KaiC/GvpD/RAD55 family RecA-like ATPase
VEASDPIPTSVDAAAELLPPEFRTFLRPAIPQSVTVRGAPGVGKTTFALGALAAFPGNRVLISTRVPVAAVRRQFAWIDRVAGPAIDLIEFVRFRSNPSTGSLSVDHMRQTLQARASDLVDVSQVLNLPSILQDHLDLAPNGPRLIAVDSWEAWVENVLGSSSINLDLPTTRWELERSMLDQLLATGASVLLVVEREERSRFDYVTDGSLLLTSTEVEGRDERWLDIAKLRGVQVRSRSYPFTLQGSRFRALVPPAMWQVGPARSEPDPSPEAGTLWPGSTALAGQIGRLPARAPVLVEHDPETPIRTAWSLVAPILVSALRSNGYAVVRPPLGIGASEIWATVAGALSPDRLARCLRVVVPPDSPLPSGAAAIFAIDGPVPAGAAPPKAGESDVSGVAGASAHVASNPTPGAHNLLLVFPSSETDFGTAHEHDPYLFLPARLRQTAVRFSSVIVMRSDDPFVNEVRVRAAMHVALRFRRGQVFLWGIRPWTSSFVFRPGRGDAGAPYELIPMV